MFIFFDSVVQRLARRIHPGGRRFKSDRYYHERVFRSAFKRFGESFALEMQQKWLRTQNNTTAPAVLTLPLSLTGSEVFAFILVVAFVTCVPIGPFLN